jgi:hypothetical protein
VRSVDGARISTLRIERAGGTDGAEEPNGSDESDH